MKGAAPYSGCGVHAISKWSPVAFEKKKKKKVLGVLKRVTIPDKAQPPSIILLDIQ